MEMLSPPRYSLVNGPQTRARAHIKSEFVNFALRRIENLLLKTRSAHIRLLGHYPLVRSLIGKNCMENFENIHKNDSLEDIENPI